MKIEFSSQKREMLLFLTTNMTAVTSQCKPAIAQWGAIVWWSHKQIMAVSSVCPNDQSPIADNQWPKQHLIELCIKPNSVAGLHVTSWPRTKAFLSCLGIKLHFHNL